MKEIRKKSPLEYSSDIGAGDYVLILLNDDVNRFDYVVECLVKICKFDYEKAEQCTLITHFKGSYPILTGSKDILDEIQHQLYLKNISTKIEKK